MKTDTVSPSMVIKHNIFPCDTISNWDLHPFENVCGHQIQDDKIVFFCFSLFRVLPYCDLYNLKYLRASVQRIVLKSDKYQSEVLRHFSICFHRTNPEILRNIGPSSNMLTTNSTASQICSTQINSTASKICSPQMNSTTNSTAFQGLLSTALLLVVSEVYCCLCKLGLDIYLHSWWKQMPEHKKYVAFCNCQICSIL